MGVCFDDLDGILAAAKRHAQAVEAERLVTDHMKDVGAKEVAAFEGAPRSDPGGDRALAEWVYRAMRNARKRPELFAELRDIIDRLERSEGEPEPRSQDAAELAA
jgi:hypothetical protein